MKRKFKELHAWGLKWANTKYSWIIMFLCAFADASFLPLPTSMFFIGLALLNTSNTYKLAVTSVIGTILGVIAGYLIGYLAWTHADGSFTGVAQFFFNYIPGFSTEFYEKLRGLYMKWDFWILFSAGYTPIPYQFFSISSGVFNLNVLLVLIATLLGQSLRFFALGYLIRKIGPEIRKIFETKMKAIAIVSSLSIATVIVVLIKII